MKVIKRDGTIVDYDRSKIVTAIEKANAEVPQAERLGREGVDAALFQRFKKASYGSMVCALNSEEQVCIEQAQGYFAGVDYLDFPAVFDTVDQADVEEALRTWCTAERSALAVVRPGEDA